MTEWDVDASMGQTEDFAEWLAKFGGELRAARAEVAAREGALAYIATVLGHLHTPTWRGQRRVCSICARGRGESDDWPCATLLTVRRAMEGDRP